MDADLAKKTNDVLFVKIDNDGYGLNTQRNAIKGGQLEEAVATLKSFRENCIEGKSFENNNLAHAVRKTEIGKSGDYNLSGERYKQNISLSSVYPIVKISDVSDVISGQSPESEFYNNEEQGMPFYQGRTEFGEIYIKEPKTWTTKVTKIAIKNDVLMSVRAPVGPVNIATQEICIGRGIAAIRPNEKILLNYLFTFLRNNQDNIKGNGGAVFDSINRNQILDLKIPLPPLSVQEEIVTEIESYQNEIEKQKKLIIEYEQKIKDRIGKVWGEKEKTDSKKLSNDLYLAMMLKQMEKKIQLNYGEVATQKTVFHLNTFTNQKLDYPFMNSNFGTYSYQLKDDLAKNPYLSKIKKGNGDVFVVTSSKENEVLEALSSLENKTFVDAINEVLKIYQTPLINKETENIELLNTVSKVILDKQTIDLDLVYAGMHEWKIEQNGFANKADKFTKARTKTMIELIVKLGLVEKLVKH